MVADTTVEATTAGMVVITVTNAEAEVGGRISISDPQRLIAPRGTHTALHMAHIVPGRGAVGNELPKLKGL